MNIQKRKNLFLLGCLPFRLLIVLIAFKYENEKILGYLSLIISLGFATIFIFGLRKTGIEVFGDEIWWNNWRPFHSFLYGSFAYYNLNNIKGGWKFLFIDFLLGIISFNKNYCI